MAKRKSFEESMAELHQAEVDLVRALVATPPGRLLVWFVEWLTKRLESASKKA